jgi:hypothetical protein
MSMAAFGEREATGSIASIEAVQDRRRWKAEKLRDDVARADHDYR